MSHTSSNTNPKANNEMGRGETWIRQTEQTILLIPADLGGVLVAKHPGNWAEVLF